MVFTIRLQRQLGMRTVGVGSASLVYEVNDHVVLKSVRVFQLPACDASRRDVWYYATESIFHLNVMRDEKSVFRILEKWPHPNIAEAIETHYPEGIYLRRYRPLSHLDTTTQSDRTSWYRDILRGLTHLHSLGIAHADLRMDNVLFNANGQAIICDFSASDRSGEPNPAQPYEGRPVPINGLAETLSDATDRFALASLIFHLKTETDPDRRNPYDAHVQ